MGCITSRLSSVDKGMAAMAGSSIHFDNAFIRREMPSITEWLNYSLIDVTTVRRLGRSWYGVYPPKKVGSHRALDDIKESIKELQFYRSRIFK